MPGAGRAARRLASEEGFDLAAQMVEFHGLGHSAVIHTEDAAAGRGVRPAGQGGPGASGTRRPRRAAIGDMYNAFLPSLTLGCGSYGRNSVSNNVSAVNLINIKRIGRRNNNLQWFKVPPKIYFEPNAIRYLADMPDVSRVTVVTDATMTRLGFVDRIITVLQRRAGAGHPADHRQRRARAEHRHRGPGRRADALLPARHHHRAGRRLADGRGQGDVAAVRAPRGRCSPTCGRSSSTSASGRSRFPTLGELAQLVCIPTTSGTGAEVTPFAVITDTGHRQEVPAGRLRAHPERGDRRPGAHRRPAAGGRRRQRLRRAHPRHRGVRVGLRQRLHRRALPAGDPADLPVPASGR